MITKVWGLSEESNSGCSFLAQSFELIILYGVNPVQ